MYQTFQTILLLIGLLFQSPNIQPPLLCGFMALLARAR